MYLLLGAVVGRIVYGVLIRGYRPRYSYSDKMPDSEDKANYAIGATVSCLLWPIVALALIITYKPTLNDEQQRLVDQSKINVQKKRIDELERELRMGVHS